MKELLHEVVKTNDYTLISSLSEEKRTKIQKTVDSLHFNLFKDRIPDIYKDAFDKIMELYTKDDLVQKRNVHAKTYLEKLQNNLNVKMKEKKFSKKSNFNKIFIKKLFT